MANTNHQRYDLYVKEATPEVLAQFKEALDQTQLASYIDQDENYPTFFSSEAHEMPGGALEPERIEEELHTLAVRFPDLKLHFIAEDPAGRSVSKSRHGRQALRLLPARPI